LGDLAFVAGEEESESGHNGGREEEEGEKRGREEYDYIYLVYLRASASSDVTALGRNVTF